jgi:hypothetical protein
VIGFFDTEFGIKLAETFSEPLLDQRPQTDPKEHIIFAPPDLAVERRYDQSGDYDFPFISYFREPFGHGEQVNMKLESEGIDVHLASQNPEVDPSHYLKVYPVDLTYEVHYWDGKHQRRVNQFNWQWVQYYPNIPFEFRVPFDKITTNVDGDWTHTQSAMMGDLTDNSDLARMSEEGVQIQYTGEVNLDAFGLVFEGRNELIKEVILNYYIERGDGSKYLAEQTIVN